MQNGRWPAARSFTISRAIAAGSSVPSGRLSTPDLSLGAVAGVAREILREQVPELETATIRRDQLTRAREIIAVNAVRGAAAIVSLDAANVADGEPGPWAARLGAMLARADRVMGAEPAASQLPDSP